MARRRFRFAALILLLYFTSRPSSAAQGDGSRLILPLTLSPPRDSSRIVSNEKLSRRHLRHSRRLFPNAYMRLYDDLLSSGYYTTRLGIGTPPQEFALIVDSGSTATYVPCSSCEQCGKHQDPKFQPNLSTTYKPVSCNPNCTCDAKSSQCVYERQYAEMSSSSGFLVEDMISFGNLSELKSQPAVFGCEIEETGDIYSQRADGIMGLGRNDLSIVDQLVDRGVINDSFSLCYGGLDTSGGAMVLGQISTPSDMVFSKSDPTRSPYYNIELKEMHVAGKKLSIDPSVFDQKHGTVVDSGTTYAYFPEAAFVAFKQAIMNELQGIEQIPGPDPLYNDICFSGPESGELSEIFPVVDLVLGSGQKYSLSPENYIFRHAKVPGAYCLGIFQNGKDPTTLLGGIIVRNTLVTYDRQNLQVGFWKTNCSELWHRLNMSDTSAGIPPAPVPNAPAPAAAPAPNAPVSAPNGPNLESSTLGVPPAPAPAPSPNVPAPAPVPNSPASAADGPNLESSTLGVASAPVAPLAHSIPGEIQVGFITFEMSLSMKYSDLKPLLSELGGCIAKDLGVDKSQVHVLNSTSTGDGSLTSWAIYPGASAEYFSNARAMHIISHLAENNVQLPKTFGSYQLLKWNAQPAKARTWWEQHYLVIVMTIILILMLGLSIYGIWFVWRWRQLTTLQYQPVSSINAFGAEQELQPL